MKTDAPAETVAHIRVAASPPDGRQSYVVRYEPPTDGFAARCEARLCLAVRAQLEVGACPRCGLWPKNSWGEARTAGLARC